VFCILLLLYQLTGKYVENVKIMGTIFNGVPPVSNSVGMLHGLRFWLNN